MDAQAAIILDEGERSDDPVVPVAHVAIRRGRFDTGHTCPGDRKPFADHLLCVVDEVLQVCHRQVGVTFRTGTGQFALFGLSGQNDGEGVAGTFAEGHRHFLHVTGEAVGPLLCRPMRTGDRLDTVYKRLPLEHLLNRVVNPFENVCTAVTAHAHVVGIALFKQEGGFA